jgi:IS30 family transposase
MQGRPFTFLERQKLELLLLGHLSLRAIGKMLQRNHGVLSREVRLGTDKRTGKYSAVSAQERADRRKSKPSKTGRGWKIENDPLLKAHIIKELKDGRMPHVISGRLKEYPPPDMEEKGISHETIFRWIYEGQGRYEDLYQYLRFGQKKRKKQRTRRTRDKTLIPDRVSIHERPQGIDEQKEYGHWESDSMVFQRGQRTRLSVQYERKAKYVMIHRLSDGTADETDIALEDSILSLPGNLWKSITFDNGKEGMNHGELKKKYGLQTYFCDPYASYQKGGVENCNGIIRRYLPREIDMTKITQKDIYAIQEKINNTPRRSLHYRTPKEVLEEICG